MTLNLALTATPCADHCSGQQKLATVLDFFILYPRLQPQLAESIAQANRGELHSIDDVFAPFTVDELEGKA